MSIGECLICGKENIELNDLYCPIEKGVLDLNGICSKACYIFSLLEKYEDQEYTNQHGIEIFDESEYLIELKKDKRIFLSNDEILAIVRILGESNNTKTLEKDNHNSRYWFILSRLVDIFYSPEIHLNIQKKELLKISV